MEYVLTVFLGVTFLHLIYFFVRSEWPDKYFAISDITSYKKSVSPLTFVAFRAIPVFLAISITTALLNKAVDIDYRFITTLTAIVLIHILLTNGKALLALLAKKDTATTFSKYTQILLNAFVIVVVIISAILGYYAGQLNFTAIYTPSLEGMVDDLWLALITALLAATIYHKLSTTYTNPYTVFEKSLQSIQPELIKYAKKYSKKSGADPVLVLAIMLVENLQRPRWVRWIENIKSKLFRHGSYGIMQVSAGEYISDKESVKIAIDEYLKDVVVVEEDGYKYLDDYSFESVLDDYNSDQVFKDFAQSAFHFLSNLNEQDGYPFNSDDENKNSR